MSGLPFPLIRSTSAYVYRGLPLEELTADVVPDGNYAQV